MTRPPRRALRCHHLLGRPDIAALDAGQARHAAAGRAGSRCRPACEPGREDHLVGAEGLDLVGIERRVEPDLHLQLGQLALVPVEEIEDLAAARLQAGKAELAAELVGRLRPA